jgi:hypothetical protein
MPRRWTDPLRLSTCEKCGDINRHVVLEPRTSWYPTTWYPRRHVVGARSAADAGVRLLQLCQRQLLARRRVRVDTPRAGRGVPEATAYDHRLLRVTQKYDAQRATDNGRRGGLVLWLKQRAAQQRARRAHTQHHAHSHARAHTQQRGQRCAALRTRPIGCSAPNRTAAWEECSRSLESFVSAYNSVVVGRHCLGLSLRWDNPFARPAGQA